MKRGDYVIVKLYCDGGCRNNQERENIGAIGLVIDDDGRILEHNDIFHNTTNNRMELKACIEGLKRIRPTKGEIIVYTDSLYLVKGITEWYPNWIERGWTNSKGKPVENRDLWEELIFWTDHHNYVSFKHVRGHGDNAGNNRADELVNMAMDEFSRKKHTL